MQEHFWSILVKKKRFSGLRVGVERSERGGILAKVLLNSAYPMLVIGMIREELR